MTGQNYRIRIRSHMDNAWSDWFEGMTIEHQANGETVLSGFIEDQAALFGTLMKLRDLGLALIAVQPVENRPDSDLSPSTTAGKENP
jgi:hypothetical protein